MLAEVREEARPVERRAARFEEVIDIRAVEALALHDEAFARDHLLRAGDEDGDAPERAVRGVLEPAIVDLAETVRRGVDEVDEVRAGPGLREPVREALLGLEAFLAAMSPRRLDLMRHLRRAGPMSVRRLSKELGRDYKSVHSEVARLVDAGLIERSASDEVAVRWDRIVTELDLAA